MTSAITSSRERLGATPALDAIAADLLERWSEPHRAYHSTGHLEAALGAVALFDIGDADRAVIEWALWFHDAIYDATATDNEERSADLAAALLNGHLGTDDVAEVVRLVLLTAGHDPDPDDVRGGVMIDIDLSILGAEPDDYDRYTAGVRHEYSHRTDEEFRSGRSQFLASMLAREHIFSTDRGHGLWNAFARRNLAAELATLSR